MKDAYEKERTPDEKLALQSIRLALRSITMVGVEPEQTFLSHRGDELT